MLFNKFPPLPFLIRKMLRFEEGIGIQLEIRAQSRNGGTLTIRGITREGIFIFSHVISSAGALSTERFSIPDIPITVTVTDRVGTIPQGDTYAILSLLVSGELIQELTAGFVFRDKGITYPNPVTPTQRPNGGHLFESVITAPPAGSNHIITVSPNFTHHVIWAQVNFTTSSTVASRRMRFDIDGPNGSFFRAIADVDQLAGVTRNYFFASYPTLPGTTHDTTILVSIPPNLILPGNSVIRTRIFNLQGGDELGAMNLYFESFPQRVPA